MRDSSLGPLLAVFYGCGFLAGFNENLVNMALVAIMGDFSIDAVAAQWAATSKHMSANNLTAGFEELALYRR